MEMRTVYQWGNLHLVGSELGSLEFTKLGSDGGNGESSDESEEFDLHVCGFVVCKE